MYTTYRILILGMLDGIDCTEDSEDLTQALLDTHSALHCFSSPAWPITVLEGDAYMLKLIPSSLFPLFFSLSFPPKVRDLDLDLAGRRGRRGRRGRSRSVDRARLSKANQRRAKLIPD